VSTGFALIVGQSTQDFPFSELENHIESAGYHLRHPNTGQILTYGGDGTGPTAIDRDNVETALASVEKSPLIQFWWDQGLDLPWSLQRHDDQTTCQHFDISCQGTQQLDALLPVLKVWFSELSTRSLATGLVVDVHGKTEDFGWVAFITLGSAP